MLALFFIRATLYIINFFLSAGAAKVELKTAQVEPGSRLPTPDSEPTWLFIKTKVKQRKEAIFHIKEAKFAAEEARIRRAMCLCKFCGPLQSVIAMFKVWLICNHQKGKNSHVENRALQLCSSVEARQMFAF